MNPVSAINSLMVEVFNDILDIEQSVLKQGKFNDISVTEVHTIEAIGMHQKPTTSDVAKKLNITVGTLTVAINNLVKKGYVERARSELDRRIVRLTLTNKGRLLFRVHENFHERMVKEAVMDLDNEETTVLGRALLKVHLFLQEQYAYINSTHDH